MSILSKPSSALKRIYFGLRDSTLAFSVDYGWWPCRIEGKDGSQFIIRFFNKPEKECLQMTDKDRLKQLTEMDAGKKRKQFRICKIITPLVCKSSRKVLYFIVVQMF